MYLAGMGVTIVASSGDNATFNDVTSGNNKCCPYQSSSSGCCSAGFLATTGWDPATGWGSINFPSFAAMFNVAVTYTSPNTSTSTSGDSGLHMSFTMVIIAAVVLVVAGSILIAGLDFPFLNLSVLPSRRLNFNIIAILTLLSISSLQVNIIIVIVIISMYLICLQYYDRHYNSHFLLKAYCLEMTSHGSVLLSLLTMLCL